MRFLPHVRALDVDGETARVVEGYGGEPWEAATLRAVVVAAAPAATAGQYVAPDPGGILVLALLVVRVPPRAQRLHRAVLWQSALEHAARALAGVVLDDHRARGLGWQTQSP